ncbi:MAG: DUF2147 domain-containing protein [Prevotellaceae bacterium]|jgi:hypothetical protein|nr:DUF2147 domain-containing protein [Prevotellaceae bacterium]
MKNIFLIFTFCWAAIFATAQVEKRRQTCWRHCTDTRNGKTYYCCVSYDAETDRLCLEGSLDKAGILGATQYLVRKKM